MHWQTSHQYIYSYQGNDLKAWVHYLKVFTKYQSRMVTYSWMSGCYREARSRWWQPADVLAMGENLGI